MPARYSDNFDRADGTIGPNWTVLTDVESPVGTPVISSGQVVGASSVHTGAFYNGDFDDDQYAEVALESLTITQLAGVGVRMSADGSSMYAAFFLFPSSAESSADTSVQLYKEIDGVFSQIDGNTIGTVPPGTKLRLEVRGAALHVYIDGELSIYAVDTDITSGKPGFLMYDSAALDDWSGNSLRLFGRDGSDGLSHDPGADSVNNIVGSSATMPDSGTLIAVRMYYLSGQASARAVIYPNTPDGTSPLWSSDQLDGGATTEDLVTDNQGWFRYTSASSTLHLTPGSYALCAWFGDSGAHLADWETSVAGRGTYSGVPHADYTISGPAPNPYVETSTFSAEWLMTVLYEPDTPSLGPANVSGIDGVASPAQFDGVDWANLTSVMGV